MAEYEMEHTGAELDEAIQAVIDGYRDVTPVTALAGDVVWGKVIVTPEGPVTGTYQGIVPPESWRKTAEGDPAVVTDGIAGWPVYSLAAPFTFGQTGEGDPAPDNVRPITAPESVTVTQTGGGQTVEVVASLASDPAVYIGTLNLKTGVVTTNAIMLTFDGSEDENWGTSSTARQIDIPAGVTLLTTNTSNWNASTHPLCVCSHFKPTNSLTIASADNYTIWWSTSSGKIRVKPNMTLSAFVTWLQDQAANGTPLQLLAELAQPVTYQLELSQMPTLAAGENSFTCDNGPVTVVYYHAPDSMTGLHELTLDGTEEGWLHDYAGVYRLPVCDADEQVRNPMCTHFPVAWSSSATGILALQNTLWFRPDLEEVTDLSSWKAWLAAQAAAAKSVRVTFRVV